MANVKTYTLTLDAQELHDLIEAALVYECQNANIARWAAERYRREKEQKEAEKNG